MITAINYDLKKDLERRIREKTKNYPEIKNEIETLLVWQGGDGINAIMARENIKRILAMNDDELQKAVKAYTA